MGIATRGTGLAEPIDIKLVVNFVPQFRDEAVFVIHLERFYVGVSYDGDQGLPSLVTRKVIDVAVPTRVVDSPSASLPGKMADRVESCSCPRSNLAI